MALKHKVRFEPYDDLEDLVGHLDAFVRNAHQASVLPEASDIVRHECGILRAVVLKPWTDLKRAKRPLGHRPWDNLGCMDAYVQITANSILRPAGVISGVTSAPKYFNNILVTTNRVLNAAAVYRIHHFRFANHLDLCRHSANPTRARHELDYIVRYS